MIIRFTIPGSPVGKERARASSRLCADGKWKTLFYTPKKTRDYEKRIREHFSVAAYKQKMPKGFEAKYVRVICYYASGIHPDGDNCLKLVIDALKGLAYHKDDRNIGSSVEPPRFDKLNPRIEVEVEN